MEIADPIIKVLPSIMTAIIASYLTAQWSLKKFYNEKRWERREQAYREIINSLYDVIQYLSIVKEDYGQGTGFSEEKLADYRYKYSQALQATYKASDIGSFVISEKAMCELKKLRNREVLDWDNNPPWDIYEQEHEYFKNALEGVIKIAQKELKINKA